MISMTRSKMRRIAAVAFASKLTATTAQLLPAIMSGTRRPNISNEHGASWASSTSIQHPARWPKRQSGDELFQRGRRRTRPRMAWAGLAQSALCEAVDRQIRFKDGCRVSRRPRRSRDRLTNNSATRSGSTSFWASARRSVHARPGQVLFRRKSRRAAAGANVFLARRRSGDFRRNIQGDRAAFCAPGIETREADGRAA